MTQHAYDDPTLNSIQFLFAVMHDPLADLDDRIRAANALLQTDYAELPGERPPAVIYRIADYRPEAEDDSTICAA
jgi:hypothetical protein